MSQENVDKRKEYNKNRKEILAKQKRNRRIGRVAGYVVIICVVVLIVVSVYFAVRPVQEADDSTFYYLIATDDYGILDPSLPE